MTKYGDDRVMTYEINELVENNGALQWKSLGNFGRTWPRPEILKFPKIVKSVSNGTFAFFPQSVQDRVDESVPISIPDEKMNLSPNPKYFRIQFQFRSQIVRVKSLSRISKSDF